MLRSYNIEYQQSVSLRRRSEMFSTSFIQPAVIKYNFSIVLIERWCKMCRRKENSTIRDVLIVMTIEKWYDNERCNASRARETLLYFVTSLTRASATHVGLDLYLLCGPKQCTF